VAMIIMGLLATIAMPRLSESREAARLSEGIQTLRTLRSAEERWRMDHGSYATSCSDLDVDVNPSNFSPPDCNAGCAGCISIRRSTNTYTIAVNTSEVYTCAGCSVYLTRYLPD
jgi:type II secretory pathway pseudopilin PulG